MRPVLIKTHCTASHVPKTACAPRIRYRVTSASDQAANGLTSEVGFGFSVGGLLFPYFIGVVESLDRNGILTRESKMAGSSAGSLISASYISGLPIEDIMEGCMRVSQDCRENGTRGRLRSVLERVIRDMLPQDAHHRCSGQAFVSITKLHPFGNELLSEFQTRDELISALMASCHVPVWFDNSVLTEHNDCLCLDGGISKYVVAPPVARTVKVSAFPLNGWGESYKVKIAPGIYSESKYTVRELLSKALEPCSVEGLIELYDMGKRDASDYAASYTVPSLDEEGDLDLLLDDDDVAPTNSSNFWNRMRSVFISSKQETHSL